MMEDTQVEVMLLQAAVESKFQAASEEAQFRRSDTDFND
jgi:hypothetical protein